MGDAVDPSGVGVAGNTGELHSPLTRQHRAGSSSSDALGKGKDSAMNAGDATHNVRTLVFWLKHRREWCL